ncbi:hypothetical protein HQN89_07755 [Paenibacillus frigoriresistens]|uniref:hypothetical protein n=1 Tax=Paenibacillus alginolyticus TaxID=59839 RepID=UPI0015657221|nr:hypothetical protein [Paenibacillus frigoriresistens]NRF90913.1 hypothetical protein [Paenibacillus frigoriresistens]
MKKVFKSVLAVALLSVSVISSQAFAADQKNEPAATTVTIAATQNKDIQKKIDEINKKYAVGQEFSVEDSNFIKANTPAIPKVDSKTVTTFSVQTDKYYFIGDGYSSSSMSNVRVSGYATVDLGVINHTVSTNFNTFDLLHRSHAKLTNSVYFTAYGIIGSGGLVKIADFNIVNECSNTDSCYQGKTQNWSGVPTNYYISPKGTVSDSGSDFDIIPAISKI